MVKMTTNQNLCVMAGWQVDILSIYHFQVVSYGFRNPPQSDRVTVIW